jgi:hypothetical protein
MAVAVLGLCHAATSSVQPLEALTTIASYLIENPLNLFLPLIFLVAIVFDILSITFYSLRLEEPNREFVLYGASDGPPWGSRLSRKQKLFGYSLAILVIMFMLVAATKEGIGTRLAVASIAGNEISFGSAP